MRIAVIGNFRKGWDTSVTDESHISDSLEILKYTVDRVQREEEHRIHEDTNLIIIAQWSTYKDDFIRDLRERAPKAVIVYWAFDYQSLPRQPWHEKLAKESDIFLSKEMDNREEYLNMGANFHWLPQDFAPNTLVPKPEDRVSSQDIDVLFTGTYLPHAEERNKLLKIIDKKYNLMICSITPVDWKQNEFSSVMDVMVDEDLATMVRRAKVNISIDHTLKEGYWSDRNAQIMVCGGFTLFRYVPMSELVFGDNISYFYDEETMLEQLDFWLDPKQDHLRFAKAIDGLTFANENLRALDRVSQMLRIVEDYNARNRTAKS